MRLTANETAVTPTPDPTPPASYAIPHDSLPWNHPHRNTKAARFRASWVHPAPQT